MKPNIEELRKKYMDHPPEGFTSEDVYKRQVQRRVKCYRVNHASSTSTMFLYF